MAALGVDIVPAQSLPPPALGVAVHKRKAGASLQRLAEGALKVGRLERSIAMNVSLARSWRNELVDEGGEAISANARPPKGEAEILLEIEPGQVMRELPLRVLGDRDARTSRPGSTSRRAK